MTQTRTVAQVAAVLPVWGSAGALALGHPPQRLVQGQKPGVRDQRGGERERVGEAKSAVLRPELGRLAGRGSIDGDHLGPDCVEEAIHDSFTILTIG